LRFDKAKLIPYYYRRKEKKIGIEPLTTQYILTTLFYPDGRNKIRKYIPPRRKAEPTDRAAGHSWKEPTNSPAEIAAEENSPTARRPQERERERERDSESERG
jgi:hypothetical protein